MEIIPAKSALLMIDFMMDICHSGGRMVAQDDEVLGRFMQARQQAATALDAIRQDFAQAAPMPIHITHTFAPGYPELEGARQTGLIGYVRKVGAFVQGDPGSAIVPELAPRAGELVLNKQVISAFSGTGLPSLLNQRGIDTVLISGVVTHMAVLAAALQGHDLGYHVIVLKDACMSGDLTFHETALEILGPLTTQCTVAEAIAAWRG